MRECKIAVEGAVVGGVARKLGAVMQLPDQEADALLAAGLVCTPPLVRCLEMNRLIGTRVCSPGDIVAAGSVHQAIDHHRNGVAEFLNPQLFNAVLPPVKSAFSVPEGCVRLRAIQPFGNHMYRVEAGEYRVVRFEEAAKLISDGLAREERRGVLVRIRVGNTRVNGTARQEGSLARIGEAEAEALIKAGVAAYETEPDARAARATAEALVSAGAAVEEPEPETHASITRATKRKAQ
jgi:hypothetical protein